MALLRFENLSFAYPHSDVRSLDRVSLSVERGEYVVLCGPSGCGKTTLLRHAKPALVPVGAKEGTVAYQNVPLEDLSPFLPEEEMDANMVIPRIRE